ncbi:hypothetical protein CR513_24333, partial [Mucuna pruriens]
MKLGKFMYFLGIEVVYSKKDIFISQRKYVLDLLKETRKLGCKSIGVPVEQNHKIESEESPLVEKSPISIAHNPIQYNKTKHIEIDRHFNKKKLNGSLIVTIHIPTGLQVADPNTSIQPIIPLFHSLRKPNHQPKTPSVVK